jgi:glycerol-3-phosphate acyltransferase PlsY
MQIFLNILVALFCLLVGYLLGAIPNGVIVGKLFYKKDPRDYGSHASGGTNTSRVLGKKAGILVIVLDILKAVIAFWGVWAILSFSAVRDKVDLWQGGVFYVWMTLVGCSIGHCWPIYCHFHGGKTVAVYMGAAGGTSWLGFIACFLSFFGVYLGTRKHKKVVSFASIISGGIILLIMWVAIIVSYAMGWTEESALLMWNFGYTGGGIPLYLCYQQGVCLSIIYLILVLRHHENIHRLKEGEEKPYNLFGK